MGITYAVVGRQKINENAGISNDIPANLALPEINPVINVPELQPIINLQPAQNHVTLPEMAPVINLPEIQPVFEVNDIKLNIDTDQIWRVFIENQFSVKKIISIYFFTITLNFFLLILALKFWIK
jgi:hypothetical protein